MLYKYSEEGQLLFQFLEEILISAQKMSLAEIDPWYMGEIYYALGSYYHAYQDPLDAIEHYKKAIDYFRLVDDIDSVLWCQYEIAEIQYNSGDNEIARNTVLNALALYEDEQDINDVKLSLYSLLGNIEITLDSDRYKFIGIELLRIYKKLFDNSEWNLDIWNTLNMTLQSILVFLTARKWVLM